MELLPVLVLALLPAAGNFGGGVLAEFVPLGGRGLSLALHAAAGVVLAVVAIEIMPGAIPVLPTFVLVTAFVLGGCFYIGVDFVVERVQAPHGGQAASNSVWMIYFAVSLDLLSDGLLIGAGSASSSGLGLALAIGQVLADVPEGFATILSLRARSVPRPRRLLLSASFAIPALVGATVAFVVLRHGSEAFKMADVVFTSGSIIVAAVEDLISEAHASAKDTRLSVLAFIGGVRAVRTDLQLL